MKKRSLLDPHSLNSLRYALALCIMLVLGVRSLDAQVDSLELLDLSGRPATVTQLVFTSGDSVEIGVRALDSLGRRLPTGGYTFRWSSSNPHVAEVSPRDAQRVWIYGRHSGGAVVEVIVNGFTVYLSVTVASAAVAEGPEPGPVDDGPEARSEGGGVTVPVLIVGAIGVGAAAVLLGSKGSASPSSSTTTGTATIFIPQP